MQVSRKVTLVAFDPAGGEHHFRTAAGYTLAGLARNEDGTWTRLSNGWSDQSVLRRATTRAPADAVCITAPYYVSGTSAAVTARDKIRHALRQERLNAAAEAGRAFDARFGQQLVGAMREVFGKPVTDRTPALGDH